MKTKFLLLSAFILLIIISSFLLNDLEISKSLYNPENSFAIFIQQYGELPGVFVLIIAIVIWGISNKSLGRKFRLIAIIFSTIITTSLLLYSVYIIFFYSIDPLNLIRKNNLVIIISVSIFLLMYIYLIFKTHINLNIKIQTFAKVSLLTGLIGYGLIIQPLKIFWGRIRFRDLDALYSNFSLWYLPNGFNGNDSFPSGHAAMGFMLLPLVILIWNKKLIIKSLVISLVYMWGVLVCLSRIVIGAHYATDVLFGFAAIILAFIFSIITFRKELSGIKN